jgi:3-oxoacyl-[acyl-carrier-protein] synthase III
MNVRIVSVGSSVPANAILNSEIEERLGLTPGWIERRTGVKQRPTASRAEATSDLAVCAGMKALRSAAISPDEIGLLLLATSTPDHLLPPTAPLVAHQLGLSNAGAIDLAGACAGFVYALILGASYCRTSEHAVLIIAANVLTRRVNQNDAATAALFADGAGAVVLEPADRNQILGMHIAAAGACYDTISIAAGGTREPLTPEAVAAGRHLMSIRDPKRAFRAAVEMMTAAGRHALDDAGLSPHQINWWIPHQANVRIIRECGKSLGIPAERTVVVVDCYANSSAATIPIALDDAVSAGRIRRGDIILLTAAGAGMLSAAAVLEW